MASMAVLSNTTLSDYSNQTVAIEVVGGCHPLKRSASYTMTVPYRCLSQTIQQIHRSGGKITQVTLSPGMGAAKPKSVQPADLPAVPVQPLPAVQLEPSHQDKPTSAKSRAAEGFTVSPKPRRTKAAGHTQPPAQSTKSAKSTKAAQTQRPKRKSKG